MWLLTVNLHFLRYWISGHVMLFSMRNIAHFYFVNQWSTQKLLLTATDCVGYNTIRTIKVTKKKSVEGGFIQATKAVVDDRYGTGKNHSLFFSWTQTALLNLHSWNLYFNAHLTSYFGWRALNQRVLIYIIQYSFLVATLCSMHTVHSMYVPKGPANSISWSGKYQLLSVVFALSENRALHDGTVRLFES